MKKIWKKTLLGILIGFLILVSFFVFGTPPQQKEITWGVSFSQKHARDLEIDWKKNYLAILDDLGVKNLRIITHWDLLSPEQGSYNFEDLDWQIREAEKRNAKIILLIGMKTARWPECHLPEWVKNLNKDQQQKEILKLLEKIVLRYQEKDGIIAWQVENESFFPFGRCPWVDVKFLKKEIDFVKSLDSKKRPIIITESGEWSPWVLAGKYGDLVGTTLYKRIWQDQLNIYLTYYFPPTFYWRKAQIVEKLFGKEVIIIELQAEPWGPGKLLYDTPVEEQIKTMDLEQFRKNIEFAKKTGLKEFYLWGAEWWFWMKEKQNDSQIWNEAKLLFSQ